MATIKFEIDAQTLERLVERAVQQRRPIALQAEVLLMEALGKHLPGAQAEVPQNLDADQEVAEYGS